MSDLLHALAKSLDRFLPADVRDDLYYHRPSFLTPGVFTVFQKNTNSPWTRTDVEEFFATASDEQRATVAFPAAFLAALGFFKRQPSGDPDKQLVGLTYRAFRYNPGLPAHQQQIDLFGQFDPQGLAMVADDGYWISEGYMLPTPKPEDMAGDVSHAIDKGIVVWRPLISAPETKTEVAGEGSEGHPDQPDAPAPGNTAYSGEFPKTDNTGHDDLASTSQTIAQLFVTARQYKAQIESLQVLRVTTSTVGAVRDDLALKLGLELLNLE